MSSDTPSLPAALSDPDTIRALHEGRARADHTPSDESPAEDHKKDAEEWLGDLKLLKGVPFSYLVPDERVLPKNSLRFFYVDPNWVRALVNGAMSVGRDHDADTAHDAVFGDNLKEAAGRAAATIRARLLGQASPDPETAVQEMRGPAVEEAANMSPMTGFLLRSVAVSDWPGLRAKGKGKRQGNDEIEELQLLRFEQLSETILLGLFQGTLTKLRLGRAVETLHFGLAPQDGHWAVSLHNPQTGAPKDEKLSAKDAMRNQGEERVVQAGALANKLANHFGQSEFTSAEYTLQMVQSTREVVFKVPSPTTAPTDEAS